MGIPFPTKVKKKRGGEPRMMDWQQNQVSQKRRKLAMQAEDQRNHLRIMTEEQIEELRKQIVVYAVISQQLRELHCKSFTAQQDDLFGTKPRSVFGGNSLMASGGNKVTTRQRWTPTSVQLEILESIYDEANGTPGKHRVKAITMELSKHGHITETNVYNWFQNRRARSKRKRSSSERNTSESEPEPEVVSPKDRKTDPEEKMYFQTPNTGYGNHKW